MKNRFPIILFVSFLAAFSSVFAQTGGTTSVSDDARETKQGIADEKKMAATTLAKLDLDCYYLSYLDIQGITLPLRDELLALASRINSVVEDGSQEKIFLDNVTNRIDPLLEWLGFYSIKSYGGSLALTGDSKTRGKAFVRFNEKIQTSAIKRVFGTPSELPARNYLPKDTALAMVSTFSLSELWEVLKEGIENFANEQANQQLQMSLFMAKEQMGIDLDALLATISNECFIGFKLDEGNIISFALPDTEPVEIPEPTAIIGLKVVDTSLFDTIRNLIAGSGIPANELSIAGESAISIPLALPSPVKIEPTLMMHDGYLLITSTPALMQEAVTSYIEQSGLIQSEEFKSRFINTPEKLTTLRYVSSRFYRSITTLSEKIIKSQSKTGSDDKLIALLQEESLRVIQSRAETDIAGYDIWDSEGLYYEANINSDTENLIFEAIRQPIISLIVVGLNALQVQKEQAQATEECHANLSIIDDAKRQWSEDNEYPDEIPTQEDLEPYIEGPFPICPLGGYYEINEIDIPATCDIHFSE